MGRALFFLIVAGAFSLMSWGIWTSGQADVANLPKLEDLTVIEGPFSEVALEECSYMYQPRKGLAYCVDLLVFDVQTPNGLRTVRVQPYGLTSFLNTVEEWQPLRGQQMRFAVLEPDYGQGARIYDFRVGERRLVRYEQILEDTKKGVIAGQLVLWVFGSMFLLVIALIPIPRVETTQAATISR